MQETPAERRGAPVAVIGAAARSRARAGAASTWGRPRSATPGSTCASARSAGRSYDWGDVRSRRARGDRRGRRERPLPRRRSSRSCERIAALVEEAVGQGFLPLVLGGDHSIAMGTLGGMAKARGPGAALWIDAHGDLNRPSTSPTGNVHGMPLAAALGVGGDGVRRATLYPTPSVDARGARRHPLARPGRARADQGARRARLHDERDRPARRRARAARRARRSSRARRSCTSASTSTPSTRCSRRASARRCSGGLSYREAHLALELVAESGLLDSLDVVEVNPILDRANETATLAVELVASALGARIL